MFHLSAGRCCRILVVLLQGLETVIRDRNKLFLQQSDVEFVTCLLQDAILNRLIYQFTL